MKSFLSYIKEENEKGHYSFFHPVKGMYKLTRDKDRNVYHVHNKFGEPTHDFYNMTTKEVLDILHKAFLNPINNPLGNPTLFISAMFLWYALKVLNIWFGIPDHEASECASSLEMNKARGASGICFILQFKPIPSAGNNSVER